MKWKKSIVRDYPTQRRTRIEDEVEDIVIDKAQMIVHEDVMVTVSYDGYVKRVSLRSYNSSNGSITGLKEGDHAVGIAKADTAWFLVGFTNLGNYFCLPIFNLEESKWKDLGSHINKYVKMNNAEKIVDAMVVPEFNSYLWIVQATKKGKVKRTPLSEFALHARAVLGLPIPKVNFFGPSASKAIVVEGDTTMVEFENLEEVLSEPDVQIRIFGKPFVKGHRRMGVLLARDESVEKALAKVERAYGKLKIKLKIEN